MRHHPQSPPSGCLGKPAHSLRALLAVAFTALPASAQIASWDFSGETGGTTSTAEVYSAQLDSSNLLTRGAGALGSAAANTFRTQSFGNDGIAISNTDYFQATFSATVGNALSLSTIDARVAGTATYAASPGASQQFAYSLDGTNFILIGSPAVVTTGGPVALPQVSLSGIAALQNVPAATTVTIRYYATGQTTGGGWGFASAAAPGTIGFAVAGTITLSGPSDTTSPAVVSKAPADDFTTAIPTTDLALTLDEAILASSGTVTLKKSSDNSTVETITVPSSQVVVTGSTATINPSATLNYAAGYYVEVTAGTFKDFANNPTPAIVGPTTWNFTTRTSPSIVISQYHEGAGSTDRYVELKNLTGSPIPLTGYNLTVWSDTDSDNEGWKTGLGTTPRVTPLTGTIPANGYFLVAETSPIAPGYAASNNDQQSSGGATAFNGDDSVVLYNGAGFTLPEVVDAVSFSANQGEDTSFYRLTDEIGFDLSPGTSILNHAATWGTKTVAEVNAATSGQAWYLRASVASGTLSLGIDTTSFLESASTTNAATATVTRTAPSTTALEVTISINDLSEASVEESIVIIPIGSLSAQFPIGAVNDSFKDGDKTVTITVSAPLFVPANQQITVLDDPADPPIPIVINEVDSDPPGSDTAEFVELYNKSNQSVDLDGLVLVFYNGDGDVSYRAIDLTGSIAAGDYLVVGNPGVSNVAITFTAGNMQNGPDAVALYAGSAFQFSSHPVTAFTTATLLDAVVYDTNDADDTGLIDALTPLKPQVDEGTSGINSIARVPNGGEAFDTSLYVAQSPTPGASNVAGNTFGTWAAANAGGANASPTDDFDKDGVTNGVEYFFGATGSTFTPSQQANAVGLISYPHPTATPGTSYVVRTSPDLVNWSLPVTTTESGGFVNYTIPPGQGKIFVRLEVIVGP